jgi:hypothetical protein
MGVDDSFQVSQQLRLNEGGTKLHDTRFLRYLRGKPWLAAQFARFSQEQQDRLFKLLGLRRMFRQAVQWDASARSMVRDTVVPDAQKFLELCDRPADFWRLI